MPWNHCVFSAIIGLMKSPLNRGGLRSYLAATALIAGPLAACTTTPRRILAGLPCLLLGAWLHTWAKGCLRQNRVVAQIGPYRFVRHPFYLANALIDAGIVIMSGWWPLAIVLPPWWLAIYLPVMRGEERYLVENFPDEYPEYKRRVPAHRSLAAAIALLRRRFSLEQPQHCRRGGTSARDSHPRLPFAVLRGRGSPR